MSLAHSLKTLREMSEEKLINLHDQAAESKVTDVSYYLDELARRSQNKQTETIIKQTETMLLYTKKMLWMTVFIAILTVVNVIAVLVPIACK